MVVVPTEMLDIIPQNTNATIEKENVPENISNAVNKRYVATIFT